MRSPAFESALQRAQNAELLIALERKERDHLKAENAALAQQVEDWMKRSSEYRLGMEKAEATVSQQERELAELAQQVEDLKAERVRMRDATNKELASLRESWDAAERKLQEMRELMAKMIRNDRIAACEIEGDISTEEYQATLAEAERALGDAQQKGGV
jgi:hypothetical protein